MDNTTTHTHIMQRIMRLEPYKGYNMMLYRHLGTSMLVLAYTNLGVPDTLHDIDECDPDEVERACEVYINERYIIGSKPRWVVGLIYEQPLYSHSI